MATSLPQTRGRLNHFLFGKPVSSEESDKHNLQSYGILLRRFIHITHDETQNEMIEGNLTFYVQIA